MKPVVLDASVILKWLLPPGTEDYQTQAWAISEAISNSKVKVIMPSLYWFEVGNFLTRKYPKQAKAHLADLMLTLGAGEPIHAVRWLDTILALTARCPVTFYDASYHALAIINQGVFVTADEKYLQIIGNDPHLLHLKDWSIS